MRSSRHFSKTIIMKSTSHSCHLCRYHIVFIPKYRRAILSPYALLLTRLVKDFLSDHGALLIENSVQPDHIHLFIEARPDVIISKLVGQLKVVLSKALLAYPDIESIYPGRNVWARGYFVGTCGVESSTIEQYIREQ